MTKQEIRDLVAAYHSEDCMGGIPEGDGCICGIEGIACLIAIKALEAAQEVEVTPDHCMAINDHPLWYEICNLGPASQGIRAKKKAIEWMADELEKED